MVKVKLAVIISDVLSVMVVTDVLSVMVRIRKVKIPFNLSCGGNNLALSKGKCLVNADKIATFA